MKYRRKPLEVEACFMEKADDWLNLDNKFRSHVVYGTTFGTSALLGEYTYCRAITNSGEVPLKFPTWLILEIDGEGCYPCSPEKFEKLYEMVEE